MNRWQGIGRVVLALASAAVGAAVDQGLLGEQLGEGILRVLSLVGLVLDRVGERVLSVLNSSTEVSGLWHVPNFLLS